IGALLGGGALFAWTRSSADRPAAVDALRAGSAAEASVRIAVLPFQNLGDGADAYFADGVTDAVRAKLAEIESIVVIARGSSEEYRDGMKPPTQIADELGVDYLL